MRCYLAFYDKSIKMTSITYEDTMSTLDNISSLNMLECLITNDPRWSYVVCGRGNDICRTPTPRPARVPGSGAALLGVLTD
eukprot:COSAG02_NODE_17315_length_1012_cov_3.140197_1_plen_80_part_10